MDNRFFEMDDYLQKLRNGTSGNGCDKTSTETLEGPERSSGVSLSQSNDWSRSLSAQNRVLLILIENGGVDLGIPELADKIISSLHIGSVLPDSAKQALVRTLREKLQSLTDNLLETAELTLNRYNAASPGTFGRVDVLRNSTASYGELKNKLIGYSREAKLVDLFILTHGSEDSIAVTGGINGQKIRDMKAEYGRPLSIRCVHMMNCVGSTLNAAWIDAGARVSSGSLRNNYLPEPTMYFFWNNWKGGQTFENAVTNAYRRTVSTMNEAVRAILRNVPVLSRFADSFSFENFDFVKDSAPVIQGLRTVTVNSDDLTFTQSVSQSLATTVLPVRLLQSLSDSTNGIPRTHTWSVSGGGIDMIKRFEGFRAALYNDPVGHCTVGYGTLVHKGACNGDASEQPYLHGVTEERATQLLRDEVTGFQRFINDSVTVELNQNQYDALVSFVYNLGTGAFSRSTLLRVLNAGNYAAVPDEIRKWTKGRVNGQLVDLPGLVTRRNAEASLFGTPISTGQSFSLSVGQNFAASFSAINYSVPGIVAEIRQPSSRTCWAAVMTTMLSWRNNRSQSIRDTLSAIGQRYVQLFDAGQALDTATAGQLYNDAGLVQLNGFNPTIEGWVGLLRQFGPLYVDVGYSGTTMTHAIIVTGLYGDGTPAGTNITYLDPAEGKIITTNFRNFLSHYEADSAVNVWPYAIVHWPAGSFSGTKSLSEYSRPFYDTGEHALLAEFINNTLSGPLANVHPLLPTTTYNVNGVQFTYGQLVTMGDFYNTYNDLQAASVDELRRLKILIERSENHYKNTIFGIGGAVPDVPNAQWGDPAIGIGHRFIELALVNNSHFAPPPAGTRSTLANNKQTWERYHAQAIQRARAGNNSQDLDAAYVINAFADHFLTDAFSAGHLINKELVINRFLGSIMTNGKVNNAGQAMFERIADGALAAAAVNRKLARFEVAGGWAHWDLNDTGWYVPEVLYRILIRVAEDTQHGGAQKVANLAAKAVHDFLNDYNNKQGVPVRNNKGNSWNLNGDGTLKRGTNLDVIQSAVKQSVLNIEDAVRNPSTPIATYYQRVWDYVPNLADPQTARIVNDALNMFTNPGSLALRNKAVALLSGDDLDILLNELLAIHEIRCKSNHGAQTVAQCSRP